MYATKIRHLISIMLTLVAQLAPFSMGAHPNPVAGPAMLASYSQGTGAVARFSIFGKDDRYQITATHHFPWSAVALVRIYWDAKDQVGSSCTGWMIGESALATAAHCVYKNGYPLRVVIMPGMNSDAPDATPFGSCEAVSGIVPSGWIKTRSVEYDYGVYHLDCSIGKQTGVFQIKATSGDWTGKSLQLAGYPQDKPGRTMWSAVGSVTSSTAKGLYYDVDMLPGQSGSPVWDNADASCPYCVVAVNSGQFPAPTKNFGARIDQAAYDFLRKESAFRQF